MQGFSICQIEEVRQLNPRQETAGYTVAGNLLSGKGPRFSDTIEL